MIPSGEMGSTQSRKAVGHVRCLRVTLIRHGHWLGLIRVIREIRGYLFCYFANFISTVTCTGTALPSFLAGENRHVLTVDTALC